jgi:hypothetical protein
MGSLRDPEGTAAMVAAEKERAALSVAQERRQAQARRTRERTLGGSRAARRGLAEDWAPLTKTGAVRLPVAQVPPIVPPPDPEPTGDVDFFQGEGPPPENIAGAGPGDTYLDTISGDIYELE